jgi:membrane dipeptidase
LPSASAPSSLHKDALVIDCHNDAIVSHILRGNLSISGESLPDRVRHRGTVAHLRDQRIGTARPVQINLPKMRQGGIDAAFFAVDVTSAWKNHLGFALDAFGFFDAEVDANSDDIVIAKSAEEIRRAKAEDKLAAILVVENSEVLERSLNVLRMLFRLGVRSIGLTHNPSTWAAAGNAEERSGGGLTNFGVQLVREMNDLGMLVDVSHIGERGFWDVLQVSESPVIASHSNCKRLCDHPRNLSDEQIEGLAKNGGVMAIAVRLRSSPS